MSIKNPNILFQFAIKLSSVAYFFHFDNIYKELQKLFLWEMSSASFEVVIPSCKKDNCNSNSKETSGTELTAHARKALRNLETNKTLVSKYLTRNFHLSP